MELHIFQTDIRSRKKLKPVKAMLNSHSDILRWSIDLEDIDKVLKVEATENLSEDAVMDLVRHLGFHINRLPD